MVRMMQRCRRALPFWLAATAIVAMHRRERSGELYFFSGCVATTCWPAFKMIIGEQVQRWTSMVALERRDQGNAEPRCFAMLLASGAA
jgi:hypothetical protein